MTKLRIIAVLLACGVSTAIAFQAQSDRSWSPGVHPAPETSPPLSPEEEMKHFYMPPGYHVEVVASEPIIQDPIAIDWDADGRMWVVEYPEYVKDLQAPEPNLDPIGRIAVLEDTNNDGRMDKRTVFADGLVQGRAVKALDHGILVLEPPDIWLMHDTNGDLKMDTKEKISTNFGRREGGVEGNANSFQWGLDNYLHSAGTNVTYSLRLKDGKFDQRPTLSRGEWGVSQDDFGRMYRNSSENTLSVDLVPTPYYARNPTMVRTRGSYEILTNDVNNLNEVWPPRPNPGTNRSYQFGILRQTDGTIVQVTAACTPAVYRGDREPADMNGNVFVGEPTANFVRRIEITDDGETLRAKNFYDKAEFLGSTDERFRPVFISSAPDGTLMIVDFYRGVIQDRSSTTLYLKDYIQKRNLDNPMGVGMGRVYRVVHDTTRRDTTRPQLSRATPAQLVQALSHPNGWWRDTAQRLLVERGSKTVTPQLKTLAASAPNPRTRVKALWVLDGNDAIDVPTVMKALTDTSRDVRTSAIRIAERYLTDPASPVQAAVLKLVDDSNWQVREQLAASLGVLPAGARETALASFLQRHANDTVAMDAALSGLRGSESGVLEKLLQPAAPQSAPAETAITMLTATIVRGGQDAPIQAALAAAADRNRAAWQRAAVLRGAEVALLNAAMPASPRKGAAPSITATAVGTAGAPCPTCPGGRAGPGGAYAFEDARRGGPAPATPTLAARGAGARAGAAAGRGGAGGRGGGGARIQLSREPAVFSALAAGTGDLETRATALLARIEWPGKPGAANPVTPLTAIEQQRYDAGRVVYQNICQACHQPDGRGLERMAPTLVGSALALAPAEVTARILLNGKEGLVGLMPPLGQAGGLTDDQIAGVLTYVRREWGQAGDPVDPASVRAARAASTGRTRPWTNDELFALIPGAGGQ